MQKILYIEDSSLERQVTRRILESHYEVLEAADGLKGLQIAQSEKLDLVLIDLNMPGMNGNEVTTRLKTLFPEVPVVAITAEVTPGTRESALAAGCAGFITKPVSAEELLRQVTDFLGGKSEELLPAERIKYQRVYQQKLVAKLEQQVRELTRANQELKVTQERLIQAERYRALAQLIRGIAHDFNNILTIILGNLTMVLMDVEDEVIREDLLAIQKAAEDGEEMIQRIRLFSPFESDDDEKQPIEIEQLIEDTVLFTKPRWSKPTPDYNATISVNMYLGKPFAVMGYPSELREVFVNLIFNAIDAMPKGGEITLKTKQEAGKGYIIISDTGIGMSPQTRQRVFEPFFTTKGKEGSGLGLFTSYGIIMKHNGSINVESEIDKGATFTISLPIIFDK